MENESSRYLIRLLGKFRKSPRRHTHILAKDLLPWLRGKPATSSSENTKKKWFPTIRSKKHPDNHNIQDNGLAPVLLQWWKALLDSLQYAIADCSVIYETLVEIVAREEFSEFDFIEEKCPPTGDLCNTGQQAIYQVLLAQTLQFAIRKVDGTATQPGTVIFCAHMLAICFFKIPGFAVWLLQALPVERRMLKRMAADLLEDSGASYISNASALEHLRNAVPAHLHLLMVYNRCNIPRIPVSRGNDRQYTFKCFNNERTVIKATKHFFSRWQTSDRALYILFYQRYHTYLQSYIAKIPKASLIPSIRQRNAILAASPAYLHLAAYMANRVSALLQKENPNADLLVSIGEPTSNNGSRTPLESYYSSVYQQQHTKPRSIDAATRRYAYCLAWCSFEVNGDLFQDMINVWIRCIARDVRWPDAKGIYCLIDFIDIFIGELQRNCKAPPNFFTHRLDLPFLLDTVQLVLHKSDSPIAHMRTLAFISNNFELLTPRPDLLDLMCNHILLQPFFFERLALHWHTGVQSYYLAILFWHIRPLWSKKPVKWLETGDGCDGRCCQEAWSRHIDDREEQGKRNRDQCALESHIKLETLFLSFQQQHQRIKSALIGLETRQQREDALRRIDHQEADSSCISIQSELRWFDPETDWSDGGSGRSSSSTIAAPAIAAEFDNCKRRRSSQSIRFSTLRRLSFVKQQQQQQEPSSPLPPSPPHSHPSTPLPEAATCEYYAAALTSRDSTRSPSLPDLHISRRSSHTLSLTSATFRSSSTTSVSSSSSDKPIPTHIRAVTEWQYAPTRQLYANKAIACLAAIGDEGKRTPKAPPLTVDWLVAWNQPRF
ncbi:hypothetical protein BCR43DRAFT_485001 [Syncephalastrum racemosum]|uniref:Uncharacterized protein n=1 Tax=Syncephalastrum racemosum TaxID=13706 RepID=A0A1X2HLN6_SYNRA|nr:hypothetical protein BCR43DRAFT_485001 [Syncephalastrum racemosum]